MLARQSSAEATTQQTTKEEAPAGGGFPTTWLSRAGVVLGLVLGALLMWQRRYDILKRRRDHRASVAAKRLHLDRRRRFARHLEREVSHINDVVQWQDHRYATLEAEVEAEGEYRTRIRSPLPWHKQSGLRRENSLAKALTTSRENLILLEGDPATGKSVSLRHVALTLLGRAQRSRDRRCTIPVYLDLRNLYRESTVPIDQHLIRRFVLISMNRQVDESIDRFLDDEFERGLEEGTWLFLFDSFDELPEVLASTDADGVVNAYADAIEAFAHGMRACRVIVASRPYRGPKHLGWPKFRILPLPRRRQLELIGLAEVGTTGEQAVRDAIDARHGPTWRLAANPMFLGMVCEHVRDAGELPTTTHSMFETHVATRLARPAGRLREHFNVGATETREAAELAAFCMLERADLGLSPAREDLIVALVGHGVTHERATGLLDALRYVRLARFESALSLGDRPTFSFVHRRFTEYFATCLLMREPQRVEPHRLLTDGRWREVAVAYLQVQSADDIAPVLEEAASRLADMADGCASLASDGEMADAVADLATLDDAADQTREPFAWPHGLLHLLDLLQEGLASRPADVTAGVRTPTTRFVFSAYRCGLRFDQKWALEVAGLADSRVLHAIAVHAMRSPSVWLREALYWLIARRPDLSRGNAIAIRQSLYVLWVNGWLRRQRRAISAHLHRMEDGRRLSQAVTLMLVALPVDAVLRGLALALVVRGASAYRPWWEL